ncbi:hypothetical protein AMC78_CH02541 [Rhizobium phaseoli]|nr:hypothetical protein AMC78_CH02541 [Rhizobium phaseoli]
MPRRLRLGGDIESSFWIVKTITGPVWETAVLRPKQLDAAVLATSSFTMLLKNSTWRKTLPRSRTCDNEKSLSTVKDGVPRYVEAFANLALCAPKATY